MAMARARPRGKEKSTIVGPGRNIHHAAGSMAADIFEATFKSKAGGQGGLMRRAHVAVRLWERRDDRSRSNGAKPRHGRCRGVESSVGNAGGGGHRVSRVDRASGRPRATSRLGAEGNSESDRRCVTCCFVLCRRGRGSGGAQNSGESTRWVIYGNRLGGSPNRGIIGRALATRIEGGVEQARQNGAWLALLRFLT